MAENTESYRIAGIARKTVGSFQADPGIHDLAELLIHDDGDQGVALPAEVVAAVKASELMGDAEDRPDLLDALIVAAALGHAYALARVEEPFATASAIFEAAQAEGLRAALNYYGAKEAAV